MQQALLIASVGQNDLQLLVEHAENGTRARAEMYGGIRAVHQALLDCRLHYVVDSDPASTGKERRVDVDWNEPAGDIWVKPPYQAVRREGGCIVLVPAKLAGVVGALRSKEVRGAIVLGTHRDEAAREHSALCDVWLREPIAAGPLIVEWLAETFGLDLGVNADDVGFGKAGWVNYLDGAMTQAGKGRNYPLDRAAVRRIDRVLVQLLEAAEAADLEHLMVCVSVGSGLPEFREAIKACVRYRFGTNKVCSWQQPEAEMPLSWLPAPKEPPTTADSFRSREHAARLVRGGDFAGAAASVPESVANDPHEKCWVSKLNRVHRYFAGTLTSEREAKALAKMSYLAPLVRRRVPRCLLVGMRAEAALHAGRIPEAIAWTCTFVDAARLDFQECMAGVAELDDIEQVIVFEPGHEPLPILREDLPSTGKACLRPTRPRNGRDTYRYRDGRSYDACWLKAIDKPALSAYYRAINDDLHPVSPRKLRNINIHSVLGQHLMHEAKNVFKRCGLWAEAGDANCCFLGQRRVVEILEALGVAAPAQLYRELVDGLCRDLATHQIR